MNEGLVEAFRPWWLHHLAILALKFSPSFYTSFPWSYLPLESGIELPTQVGILAIPPMYWTKCSQLPSSYLCFLLTKLESNFSPSSGSLNSSWPTSLSEHWKWNLFLVRVSWKSARHFSCHAQFISSCLSNFLLKDMFIFAYPSLPYK